MWKFVVVLMLVLVPVAPSADIFRHEDEEGVVHFTDAPDDPMWRPFMQGIKKSPAKSEKTAKDKSLNKQHKDPVPEDYVLEGSGGDGFVWAVRTTNVKGSYYWYMGPYGRQLVSIKGTTVFVLGGSVKVKNNEVVFSIDDFEQIWPKGTTGYLCYIKTVSHSVTH